MRPDAELLREPMDLGLELEVAERATVGRARFHMRTCGGTERLCRTLYHAGLTSDLLAVLRQLGSEGRAPAFLVGFSLGGNVALKLAGEMGESAEPLVRGVCAVSAPLDLAACAGRIAQPENRLYERRFVRRMRARLRRSFEWPEGQYKLTGEAPLHPNVKRIPVVSVIVHGIRSALRSFNLADVMKVIEPHMGDAPHVVQSRSPIIPLMGLSPRELRFVEHVMDGVTSTSDIFSRGGIGKDTAVQILFVLHIFAALEWLPAEHVGGETLADRINARAAKIDRVDHFDALGVHWSVPRADIDRAYRSLQEILGSGGRGEQVAPAAAAKILARATKAYEVVSIEASRRAYLLEIHPDVDYEAIESIAENQAEWYSWRGVNEATLETRRLKGELIELARMQHQDPKKH